MEEFNLHILEADSTFYEGKCISLVIPTTNGSYGILAHHSSMVTVLDTGIVKFTTPGGERLHAAISGGILRVADNDVLILSESAEKPDEIDEKRVNAAIERANKEMLAQKSASEYRAIQAKLSRALNRLEVKRRYKK